MDFAKVVKQFETILTATVGVNYAMGKLSGSSKGLGENLEHGARSMSMAALQLDAATQRQEGARKRLAAEAQLAATRDSIRRLQGTRAAQAATDPYSYGVASLDVTIARQQAQARQLQQAKLGGARQEVIGGIKEFALNNKSLETGLTFALLSEGNYNSAIRQANTSLDERVKLYDEARKASLETGSSLSDAADAQQALLKAGQAYTGTMESGVSQLVELHLALGVSYDESAHLLAVSKDIGASFGDVANVMATVAQRTGLSAEHVGKIADLVERINQGYGQGGGNVPATTGILAALEANVKRQGGPEGIATGLAERLSDWQQLGGRGLGFGTGGVGFLNDPERVKEVFGRVAAFLSQVPKASPAFAGLASSIGLSVQQATYLIKANDSLSVEMSSLAKHTKTLQDTYDEQAQDTNRVFGQIWHGLEIGFLEAMKPVVFVWDNALKPFLDEFRGSLVTLVETLSIVTQSLAATWVASRAWSLGGLILGGGKTLLGQAGELGAGGAIKALLGKLLGRGAAGFGGEAATLALPPGSVLGGSAIPGSLPVGTILGRAGRFGQWAPMAEAAGGETIGAGAVAGSLGLAALVPLAVGLLATAAVGTAVYQVYRVIKANEEVKAANQAVADQLERHAFDQSYTRRNAQQGDYAALLSNAQLAIHGPKGAEAVAAMEATARQVITQKVRGEQAQMESENYRFTDTDREASKALQKAQLAALQQVTDQMDDLIGHVAETKENDKKAAAAKDALDRLKDLNARASSMAPGDIISRPGFAL